MSATEPYPDLKSWLEGHHRVVTYNDFDYHVFAKTGPSAPFLPNPLLGASKEADIDIAIGPAVVLQIRGSYNTSEFRWPADMAAYIKLPLLPSLKVGDLKGILEQPIHAQIDLPEITGTVQIWAQDGFLTVQFYITAFGLKYPGLVEFDTHQCLIDCFNRKWLQIMWSGRPCPTSYNRWFGMPLGSRSSAATNGIPVVPRSISLGIQIIAV